LVDTIVSPSSAMYIRNPATIVASYVTQHEIKTVTLPDFIRNVFDTLKSLNEDYEVFAEQSQPIPARGIEAEKSIFPDYLLCLEDGERHKMLKRHLWTRYRMTPDDYRKRWGLPSDYPMVAPNYAKVRSKLAKRLGPGGKKI
jgi:predicted transcriptional regulator